MSELCSCLVLLSSSGPVSEFEWSKNGVAALMGRFHAGDFIMATIHKYIPKELLFDPDTLTAMGDAYDRAIRSFPTTPAQSVREVIATQIIYLARGGLRDPIQLCQEALAAYGIQSECA